MDIGEALDQAGRELDRQAEGAQLQHSARSEAVAAFLQEVRDAAKVLRDNQVPRWGVVSLGRRGRADVGGYQLTGMFGWSLDPLSHFFVREDGEWGCVATVPTSQCSRDVRRGVEKEGLQGVAIDLGIWGSTAGVDGDVWRPWGLKPVNLVRPATPFSSSEDPHWGPFNARYFLARQTTLLLRGQPGIPYEEPAGLWQVHWPQDAASSVGSDVG
jgi:hypothetical protein